MLCLNKTKYSWLGGMSGTEVITGQVPSGIGDIYKVLKLKDRFIISE